MRRLRVHGSWCLLTSAAVILAACQTEEPNYAEQVLRNGRILTVDNDFSIAEALAIQGERIVAVGSNVDIEEQIGPDTRVIDLAGRTVIPGLIDNHMHFIRAVQRWNLQARIDGVNSKQQALDIMAAKAASMEPGEWLMVQGGWRENQFVDGPSGFTLEELDAAAPENPLFLQITYQSVYANSLALEAVGVSP
ncbi:MAG: amidohydrolase family protein, partial [Rhodospirillaceae bacterium]|nr:amidohydrolase family protein [Rhodospirillaceae bacterium]